MGTAKKSASNVIYKATISMFLALAMLLTTCVPAFADLSSLTDAELRAYKKALQQARYYKYYEGLVKGEDRIKVVDVKKVSVSDLTKTTKLFVFEIKVDLTIKDKVFRRTMKMPVTVKVKEESRPLPWIVAGAATVIAIFAVASD